MLNLINKQQASWERVVDKLSQVPLMCRYLREWFTNTNFNVLMSLLKMSEDNTNVNQPGILQIIQFSVMEVITEFQNASSI